MALFDWNLNGQDDHVDNFIEYQYFSHLANQERHSRCNGDKIAKGCIIFAIVLGIGLLTEFLKVVIG